MVYGAFSEAGPHLPMKVRYGYLSRSLLAIEWKEKCTKIRFVVSKTHNDIYKHTYLPEGFKEKSISMLEDAVMITYSNDADIEIVFAQRTAITGTLAVDNEYTTFTEVDISSDTAFLFKSNAENELNVLIWSSNNMIFELSSKIEVEQLLLIAESIKKF